MGVRDADQGYRVTRDDAERAVARVAEDPEFAALVGQARLTALARQRFYSRLQAQTGELLGAVRSVRGG